MQLFDPDRPFSPSALETYATCPHRYFLANVLGLKAIEEPEETIQISALDRGSLVHKVLERFLSEPPADGEPLLHGAGEEGRLLGILNEECQRAEDHGETGYPLIWRHDRAELREDMRSWLDAEREDEEFGRLPRGRYEVGFSDWSRGEDDGGSHGPIEITAGGARLRVSGYIDRLNWDAERMRYRVIDYKTGKVRDDHKPGQLRGGRALQLPLYLLAGGRILGLPAERGSAEYHFATRRGRFARVEFDGGHLAERGEDIDRLLAGITGAIGEGVFLRAPQNERQCEWCDFDSVCPSNRFRQIERKSADERHEAFHLLRAIE